MLNSSCHIAFENGKEKHPLSWSSMGEQEHSSIFAIGFLRSGIMRSSRTKLFVYAALIGTFFIIMFIFSRTHSNLKELEGVNQKCQQQRDSLSAQLQVVYEHKNRLEKSLQQEKSEHTHTRDECDTQRREMERKQQQDKEKLQSLEKQHNLLKSSYSQLDDDKNILEGKMQDKLHDLEKQKGDEILKLQTQLNDLLEEKNKLEKSNAAYKSKLQEHMGELNICRFQFEQMELKLNSAREEMKKLKSHAPVAEFPEKVTKTLEEQKHETVPKVNGGSLDVYEKVKNVLSNVSLHKDKQVLMRPNIQPPEIRKPSPGSSVAKYSKDDLDVNVNQGSLLSQGDSPVKIHADAENDPNKRNSETQNQETNKMIGETNDIVAADDNNIKLFHQDPLNHPQVQPPHNFDDAVEHGEINVFQQEEQKHQLEQPLNRGHNILSEMKKSNSIGEFPHPMNNGLAAPQLQGLMDKPADDNYVHDSHVHPPFELPNNVNLVKRESHLDNRNAVDRPDREDDDDDQDGENDEEQLIGGGAAVRGRAFQDTDFEDQDNGDNENGAKEEEGVVVAPR